MFRRLVLGIVIEALLEDDVDVDFRTIRIRFDDDSEFKVPRLDNYMRFKGTLEADLHTVLDAPGCQHLADTLRRAWPDLLEVLDIPIGDRLTVQKNDVLVEVREPVPGRLRVAFDLVAD